MTIRNAYNSWAKSYDSVENKTRDLEKIAAQQTLSQLSFSNVIELGCGTGKNAAWIANTATSVIAIDFSQEMLAVARSKVTKESVTFQVGDLTLPWNIPDDHADLITCSLTLEHIEDLIFIFQQAGLKLQANGKFFICEYHPAKQYLGGKAKIESDDGITEIDAFVHHITDFLSAANESQFTLLEMREWFDNEQRSGTPRLVSFVFEKGN